MVTVVPELGGCGLRKIGFTRSADIVIGRFEADVPNLWWTGDGLHGPTVGGRKAIPFAFLDDHSGYWPAAGGRAGRTGMATPSAAGMMHVNA